MGCAISEIVAAWRSGIGGHLEGKDRVGRREGLAVGPGNVFPQHKRDLYSLHPQRFTLELDRALIGMAANRTDAHSFCQFQHLTLGVNHPGAFSHAYGTRERVPIGDAGHFLQNHRLVGVTQVVNGSIIERFHHVPRRGQARATVEVQRVRFADQADSEHFRLRRRRGRYGRRRRRGRDHHRNHLRRRRHSDGHDLGSATSEQQGRCGEGSKGVSPLVQHLFLLGGQV